MEEDDIIPKLLEFVCPKCGRQLVWAPERSSVLCNGCYKWIYPKNLKSPKRVDIINNNEQIVMF
jgi:NMD protein affecting ribosome stability and mRNA decay